MIAILLQLLLPFIQLGVTYWISVASLGAILTLSLVDWRLVRSRKYLSTSSCIIYLVAIAFGFLCFFDRASLAVGRDLLFNVRVLLFWFATGFIVESLKKGANTRVRVSASLVNTIVAISVLMLIFVSLQFIKLRSGYFGLPASLYVQNSNTLPGSLDIMYTKIRPFGTFGEPSYLAFYCTSILIVAIALLRSPTFKRQGIAIIGLMMMTGIISQSLSFLLSVTLIGGVAILGWVIGRFKSRNEMILVFGPMIAIVLLVVLVGSVVISTGDSRLSDVASGKDSSANIRILAPLHALFRFVFEHPFGLPQSQILPQLVEYSLEDGDGRDLLLDNAALNTLFGFGIFGFVVLYQYLRFSFDRVIFIYLATITCFNGSVFTIDKLTIIGTSLIIYAGIGKLTSEDTKARGR